jgi:hypothetical protein
MFGMSAALHQGLRDLQDKNPKIIEVTEEEYREQMRLQGVDRFDIDIAIQFMKAGADVGGAPGVRIRLVEKKS